MGAVVEDEVVATLMKKKKKIQARLKQVEEDHKDLTESLHLAMTRLNAELRVKCDHEWRRDNHAYAELYCKHCGIWY
jgi:hypothetical protein